MLEQLLPDLNDGGQYLSFSFYLSVCDRNTINGKIMNVTNDHIRMTDILLETAGVEDSSSPRPVRFQR